VQTRRVASVAMPRKKVPRGPQVARGADRGLLAAARKLLGHLVPAKATETGRSVSVFKRTPTIYEARGFIAWKTPRGKPGAFGESATGEEPGGADIALANLVWKLEKAPLPGTPRHPDYKPSRAKAKKRAPARKRGGAA
jgi:hypothetical protein